jgi:4-diphosphocytidyl-2-C-methyl-D-erythritol kinase
MNDLRPLSDPKPSGDPRRSGERRTSGQSRTLGDSQSLDDFAPLREAGARGDTAAAGVAESMGDTVTRAFAPAKLNLYLHVTGRRPDGYHLLDSLVAFADYGDVLHAGDAPGLSLEVTGPFAAGLAGESDNLVLRAARALAAQAGVPAHARLVLEKRLPVASGIGGGSADAAATLRLLALRWRVSPDPAELDRLALRLGADVPVCLHSRPARMGGVGEKLQPAPVLPSCHVLLINPGVAVATAAVFRARSEAFSPPAQLPDAWPDAAAMAAGLATLSNDLEAPALGLCPAIAEVLGAIAAQPGCLLARMSGSGATCFGLFADRRAAEQAARVTARLGWWVVAAALLRN